MGCFHSKPVDIVPISNVCIYRLDLQWNIDKVFEGECINLKESMHLHGHKIQGFHFYKNDIESLIRKIDKQNKVMSQITYVITYGDFIINFDMNDLFVNHLTSMYNLQKHKNRICEYIENKYKTKYYIPLLCNKWVNQNKLSNVYHKCNEFHIYQIFHPCDNFEVCWVCNKHTKTLCIDDQNICRQCFHTLAFITS